MLGRMSVQFQSWPRIQRTGLCTSSHPTGTFSCDGSSSHSRNASRRCPGACPPRLALYVMVCSLSTGSWLTACLAVPCLATPCNADSNMSRRMSPNNHLRLRVRGRAWYAAGCCAVRPAPDPFPSSGCERAAPTMRPPRRSAVDPPVPGGTSGVYCSVGCTCSASLRRARSRLPGRVAGTARLGRPTYRWPDGDSTQTTVPLG